jgi:hypothetical protein
MEMEKLSDHYAEVITKIKKKVKATGLKNNSSLQLVEEKFRLDMFNSISNALYPKEGNK